MQRLKVNDYCEFPEIIDFRRWTKEGIDEAEQPAKQLQKEKSGDGISDIDSDEEEKIPEVKKSIIDLEVSSSDAKSLDSCKKIESKDLRDQAMNIVTEEQQVKEEKTEKYKY